MFSGECLLVLAKTLSLYMLPIGVCEFEFGHFMSQRRARAKFESRVKFESREKLHLSTRKNFQACGPCAGYTHYWI